MLPRLVLALVAAVVFLLPTASRTLDTQQVARRFVLYVGIALGLVWLMELVFAAVATAISHRLERWSVRVSAHPKITVAVAALVATLIACYPTLFFDRSLVSPVMWERIAEAGVQRQALAGGEIPLWNRYEGAGQPLIGRRENAPFDPLRGIALISADPVLGWDLKLAAHRFVWSWGVGVAVLVAVGGAAPAAITAATSAFLSLYAFGDHAAVFALTYAPWVLAAWFLIATASDRQGRARAVLLLAIASTLLVAASPPPEALVVLLALSSIGLLTIMLGDGGPGRRRYRLTDAFVAVLSMLLLTAPLWWTFIDTRETWAAHDDISRVLDHRSLGEGGPFEADAHTLAMILGPLAPAPLSPGLQTLTGAFVVAALLSPRRLLAHRSVLACVLSTAGLIAVAYRARPTDLLASVPLIADMQGLEQSVLTVSIMPIMVVSGLGVRAVLEASRIPLALFTAAVAACAVWVFNEVGGWSGNARVDGWLSLFALGGAVAVPASFRAAARSFPRVLPVVSAVALAVVLMLPAGQHLPTGQSTLDAVLFQPPARTDVTGPLPAVVRAADELSPDDPTVATDGSDPVLTLARETRWPRGFFVDRVTAHETTSDLVAQAEGPIASILSSDADAAELTAPFRSGSGEVIRGDRFTLGTNATTFRVLAPRAGIAVLAEPYMPEHFVAMVNGQRVPYFRVNHAFKGVVIPGAGEWYVRFEYRPRYWGFTLAAAALGALVLLGLGIAASRDGSRRRSTRPLR